MSDREAAGNDAADAALNDRSNYQGCFVCGARNDAGLKLQFQREGDLVVAEFLPQEQFQGFPGVVHGGILASLLDEALSRTALLYEQWVMTGRLEVRYRRPATSGISTPLARGRSG